ncbi:hypothetical protein IWQ57_003132 [Coemansia nantahalensis]|uniref:Uncharacterized protein n=1 Tax=Coemansia nantahalensis TaxID=2789366 RepID=A0ACC1JXR4_9FUNG|nr:hypothetical protein IWQ57_003132 [Coemansia nantahalensis]
MSLGTPGPSSKDCIAEDPADAQPRAEEGHGGLQPAGGSEAGVSSSVLQPEPLAELDSRDRRSLWEDARWSFRGMPPAKQARVLITTAAAYVQIVVGVVVLALSARETCDRPLRTFVILHIVRLFAYYPLYLQHKIWPEEEWAARKLRV